MKYYREVKLPKKAKYCVWPMSEDVIHEDHVAVEPYELPTEEEIVPIIDSWVRKSFGRPILKCEYRALAKAITNLLKGER